MKVPTTKTDVQPLGPAQWKESYELPSDLISTPMYTHTNKYIKKNQSKAREGLM